MSDFKFNSNNTYWNGNGKFQNEEESLSAKLMPIQGKADTFEGELIRASSKIYHDLYNNGFGNNWSGAYNFLQNSNIPLIKELLDNISDYRCGGVYASSSSNNPFVYKAVEDIADAVAQYVISKNGVYTPNETDMLTLSEPDYIDEDEYEYDH